MEKKPYIMGDLKTNTWRSNESQQLTFVVTQECNLRCGYCYMVGKNSKHRMEYDTAKKIVDYFVDNRELLFTTDYVVLDFIGGEPLLELELIDKIVDYFRLKVYNQKSRWFGRFRILVQSNGVLVNSEAFHKFLRKNKDMVSIGITIDGTKEKHDMQRVFPNGEGSYSIVEKNYKLFLQEGLVNDTKVTFGHEDLKYIKESIVHLWKMGIKNVPANIVHENVWKENDDIIYEEQLTELADYVIDNNLWKEYNTSLFYDKLGFRATDDAMMSASCGTGSMYCVDANGDIYNCVRFMDYSLNNGKPSKKIGDIYSGVDEDRKRPLKTLFPQYISEQKCIDCRVNLNCSYCSGNNYDASENNSMFSRSIAGCDMHKARVRANNYFWARLYNEHSVSRDIEYKNNFFMYFILSTDCVSFCDFQSSANKNYMKPEDLLQGLSYAFQNFYQPVFVHSDHSLQWLENLLHSEKYGEVLAKELGRHIVKHIMKYQKTDKKNVLYVIDDLMDLPDKSLENPVILNIDAKRIGNLAKLVILLLPFVSRININILNIDNSFDLNIYGEQLQRISEELLKYLSEGKHKEIRQLTDKIFVKKMNNCFAGENNMTLAPDGKFYFCPAFYFNKKLNIDIETTQKLTVLSKAPICNNCDAFQCSRCIYKNYTGTGELNTPTKIQCRIAHLERKYSVELLNELHNRKISDYEKYSINSIDYNDPIEQFEKNIKQI